VETGFGGKWNDKERGFYDLEQRTIEDALREIEVEPESITHVIVSHLHFDHAAGLTRTGPGGAPVPTFPHAEVIVQRREWDDALANRSTMTRTYLKSHLKPVADRVRVVDGEIAVLPNVTVWPMPGHTWGQQAVRFDDAEGTVVFAGDVMPTRHHVHPAFSMGYDMEPYANMQSKRELLARAAGEGWRLVLDHEPGEAVVRVRADADHADRWTLTDGR
jgi:glyoxylase-like metal-dependent hydrolase (beta-lactamase superfamily II)